MYRLTRSIAPQLQLQKPSRLEPLINLIGSQGFPTGEEVGIPFWKTRCSGINDHPVLDILAPGQDILSTWHNPPNSTRTISGTSMGTSIFLG